MLRPGIVHRIDKDTTGVLIVCKNDQAHQSIAAQLKAHSITRKYYAIVHGNLKDDEGTVDAPIGRHPTDRKKMAEFCGDEVMARAKNYTFWYYEIHQEKAVLCKPLSLKNKGLTRNK